MAKIPNSDSPCEMPDDPSAVPSPFEGPGAASEKTPVNASPAGWARVLVSYRWPLAVVAVALIAYLVYRETVLQVDRLAESAGELAGAAAETAENVARNLLTGDITESFIAAIPELDAGGSGNLELATARATEIFTRTDERRILWDSFSLGTTVTEIRVPVTYRYHLRLTDPWRIEIAGSSCVVYAPRIRPTLPPAIHTDGMEKRADAGWLRFDADDQLEELEKSITPRLVSYARDARHVDWVRERSRRTVREFVRSWLLREGQSEDGLRAVVVVFPDELEDSPLEGLETTEGWEIGDGS